MSYRPKLDIVVTSATNLPTFPPPPDGTFATVLGTPEPAISQNGSWYQGGQLVKAAPSGSGVTAFAGFPIPTTIGATAANAYARLYRVPSDVTQVNVNIANETYTAQGAALTSNMAAFQSDPAQSNKLGALIHDFGAQTVPADTTYLRLASFAPTRGPDGYFAFCFSSPASGGNRATDPSNWHGWQKAGSTTVNPFPVPDGPSTETCFKISLEYQTYKRRFLFDVDSLGVNSSGSPLLSGGFLGGWINKLGFQYDVAIDIRGYGGATLGQRAQPLVYPNLYPPPLPDLNTNTRVLTLGANDTQFDQPSTMATDAQTIIGLYQAAGAGDIYLCTIMPIAFYSGHNTTRVGYNNIARANWRSWGVKELIDFDLLVDPAQNLTALPSGLTSDGGSHMNQACNDLLLSFAAPRLGL